MSFIQIKFGIYFPLPLLLSSAALMQIHSVNLLAKRESFRIEKLLGSHQEPKEEIDTLRLGEKVFIRTESAAAEVNDSNQSSNIAQGSACKALRIRREKIKKRFRETFQHSR